MGQALPNFFCDKGHEGMQKTQCLVKHIHKHLQSGLLLSGILTVQSCLCQFNIPVTVGVPQEVVHLLHRNAQLILLKIFSNLGNQRVQLGQHPLIGSGKLVCCRQLIFCVLAKVHQHIAAGVPQLIGKIPHCFASLHIKAHIIAGCIAGDHVHTQSITAVLINHFQRINAVAKRFGHLTALIITNEAVNQHCVERCLSGLLTAGENHSGNPEEDDIITGDKNICRIEIIQIFCLFRPTQRFKGPQSRAEPGIKDIGVALNVGASTLLTLTSIRP